jgi:hypothetical protein
MRQPDFANAAALLEFDPQLLAVFESCESTESSEARQITSQPAEIYLNLRDRMLGQPIADIVVEPELSDIEVRAVLVENCRDGEAVTLVALADDTVSLYLGAGGGELGLGSHAQVREASRALLRKADSMKHLMSPGNGHSPPPTGCMVFVLRTPQGNLAAEVLEFELMKDSHPLSPLSKATADLLSTIRRVLHEREERERLPGKRVPGR